MHFLQITEFSSASNFSRNIVLVDERLLEKHMQTSFILSQSVSRNPVKRYSKTNSESVFIVMIYLLIKTSKPTLLSSINSSSKIPSSSRKNEGNWLSKAFPGKVGIII